MTAPGAQKRVRGRGREVAASAAERDVRTRATCEVVDLRQAGAEFCGCCLVELRERHHRLDR